MNNFKNNHNALDTITTVFEAMAKPEIWPLALDKIAYLCDAKYSVLYFHDDAHQHTLNTLMNHVSAGFPFQKLVPYLEKYGHYDLEAIAKAFELDQIREEYRPFEDIEAFNHDEGLEHPMFSEGRETADFYRRAGIVIGRNQPWDSIILLQYAGHLDHFPNGSFENFKTIAPYIERAVNAGRYLIKLQQLFNQSMQILDRLKVAVCVVNGTRDLILKNKSFDRLVEEQSGFRISKDKKLKVLKPDENQIVDQALEKAFQIGSKNGMSNGASLVMKRDRDRVPISIEISPMISIENEKSTSGYAIIFAVDPDWALVKESLSLSKAFGFSKVESQIMPLILSGRTNREIAEIRDVSDETIKSQVSSILRKTNSLSRTELAMLAAAAEIPIND